MRPRARVAWPLRPTTMSTRDHSGDFVPNDLSSIDSSNGSNGIPTRHELAGGEVVYQGGNCREWIRHDGALEVEL